MGLFNKPAPPTGPPPPPPPPPTPEEVIRGEFRFADRQNLYNAQIAGYLRTLCLLGMKEQGIDV